VIVRIELRVTCMDHLRYVIYVACEGEMGEFSLPCSVIRVSRRGSGVIEVWVKCSSIGELVESLLLLEARGYIVAIAGVDGSLVEGVPRALEDLESLGLRDLVLGADDPIEVEFGDTGSLRVLLDTVKAISINYEERVARVVLAKPLHLTKLFDAGLRLLKPRRLPP